MSIECIELEQHEAFVRTLQAYTSGVFIWEEIWPELKFWGWGDIFSSIYFYIRSEVGTANALRAALPKKSGSDQCRTQRLSYFLKCSDRFWGPLSLLFDEIGGYSGRGVKLTIHLLVVLRLKICGVVSPLPIRFHGVNSEDFTAFFTVFR
jgi:hypothetical protein